MADAGSGLPADKTPAVPVTYEPELSEEVAAKKSGLRTGWTTGACATAAAKAAVVSLMSDCAPGSIDISLPDGRTVSFEVESSGTGNAAVVKDAGDDPDCTHGARMTVDASWIDGSSRVEMIAGEGVGTITKPGLGLAVGAPAINPVPRKMIESSVAQITNRSVRLVFSVPGGEEMAAKTTNDRLGIVGGISILGTTGVVKPFSTAAYRASVVQQIDVAAHQGEPKVVLSTGHRSEKAAMRELPDLDKVCFVEVGDFTGIALRRAAAKGISTIIFVGMAGKIAKLAAGVMMTHYRRTVVDTGILERAALEANAPAEVVQAATETATARHFFERCVEGRCTEPLVLLARWAQQSCAAHIHSDVEIEVWMVDFEGDKVVARA